MHCSRCVLLPPTWQAHRHKIRKLPFTSVGAWSLGSEPPGASNVLADMQNQSASSQVAVL